MPIRAFFAFYRQAIKMEAAQHRERLDISMSSVMKLDYYKMLRARYNSLILQKEKELPPKPPEMYLDPATETGKTVIMDIFKALKRSAGYG
jgi:hypothetical protein